MIPIIREQEDKFKKIKGVRASHNKNQGKFKKTGFEQAVKQVLKEGYRTIDIMPQEAEKRASVREVGTEQMGDLIAERV